MPKGLLTRFGKQLFNELKKGNFKVLGTLKYYSKWKESLRPGRNSIVDERPWITFPVIELLNKLTNADSRVFEYGGGGSTLFFANRVKEIVTVEHDGEWFTKLQKKIKNKNALNWSGNLVMPEMKTNHDVLDPANPLHYFSADKAFSNKTFKSYANFIDKFPDSFFDIVLVDGRVRPSCIWHSIPKLKKGGYLIIDNSDRKYYFSDLGKSLARDFDLVYNRKDLSPYVDFFTQTGVWQKR